MKIASPRNFLIPLQVIRVDNGKTRALRTGAFNEGSNMLNTPVFILLALYSAIIVASYFVVRRGWMRAYPVFVVSGVGNALVVFAFCLVRGTTLVQAILVGLFAGFLFAALSVFTASVYRDTVPSQADLHELIVSAGAENRAHEQAHGAAA